MPSAYEQIGERLEELCTPSATEVRRAKRAVLEVLADGAAHRTAALMLAGRGRLGVEEISTLKVEFLERAGPDNIPAEAPTIAFLRAQFATQIAIGRLVAEGLALPALDPENDEPRHDASRVLIEGTVRVAISQPAESSGAGVNVARPALAEAYVATAGLLEPSWYLEPDLFLEELLELDLDERARRALRESLASFRRGLYLAAVSLLGVVSEAAWYRAAERLAKPDGALAKAIAEGQTARVQKGVAELLRSRGAGSPATPDELLAQAALLRELRNYGVHPAPARDDLERFLAEEEAGLLLLRTHRYLVNLSQTVADAEAATSDAS